jgi:hypothetical protein
MIYSPSAAQIYVALAHVCSENWIWRKLRLDSCFAQLTWVAIAWGIAIDVPMGTQGLQTGVLQAIKRNEMSWALDVDYWTPI